MDRDAVGFGDFCILAHFIFHWDSEHDSAAFSVFSIIFSSFRQVIVLSGVEKVLVLLSKCGDLCDRDPGDFSMPGHSHWGGSYPPLHFQSLL